MNEREKIIEIIESDYCIRYHQCEGCRYEHKNCKPQRLADALIANGIGDVAAWKRRYDLAESLRNIYWRSLNIIEKEVKVASEMTREAAEREIEEEENNGKK